MRLDQYLVEKGYFDSREKAKEAIQSASVLLNGKPATKAAQNTPPNAKIELIGESQYVSRSGHKLEAALKKFKVNPRNLICLDVGSSTGGFTQCLLENGAKQIFSVDVGTMQMHPKIRDNKRVILQENTDIRNFVPPLNTIFDLIVIDVSFISLENIFPAIKAISGDRTTILALFKPQFEVGKVYLKKGICKHPNISEVMLKFEQFLNKYNFNLTDSIEVPLRGKEGNQEYFFKILPSILPESL